MLFQALFPFSEKYKTRSRWLSSKLYRRWGTTNNIYNILFFFSCLIDYNGESDTKHRHLKTCCLYYNDHDDSEKSAIHLTKRPQHDGLYKSNFIFLSSKLARKKVDDFLVEVERFARGERSVGVPYFPREKSA